MGEKPFIVHSVDIVELGPTVYQYILVISGRKRNTILTKAFHTLSSMFINA